MLKIIQKPSEDYYPIETVKDMIVLHYTGGGTLSGAEATLAIRDYVNVHFGIDDDGTIHQYFDEKYWAYHTGTNKKDAMRSIGIEIRCWGHLTRKGDALYTWTGKKIPWTKVVRLLPYRGFEYWEMISPQQLEAVRELVLALSCRHPVRTVTSHARLNKQKLDFPPDYPGIKDMLYEFTA